MMKSNVIISTVIFGGACVNGSSGVMAQTFGMEYTTEWQTDFKKGYDWLNQLKTTSQVSIGKGFSFDAFTISAAKCGDVTLIDDLLTYSNIEAGNIPLTFTRLGFVYALGNSEWFVGINNVNEDYFTSDLTSFFINSSCGITPTISCNVDIANYPEAAWCVHYRRQAGNISLQSSLYPGKGYHRLAGHDNLFSLNIKRDGIFSISSIDYKRNDIYIDLGVALHYGMCMADAEGEPIETQTSVSKKRFSATPWFLTEIALPNDFGIIAHGSFSTVHDGCKIFGCVGAVYNGGWAHPGFAFNYASFSATKEIAAEFSCRIPIYSDMAFIQPAVHLVATDRERAKCIGMLRMSVNI